MQGEGWLPGPTCIPPGSVVRTQKWARAPPGGRMSQWPPRRSQGPSEQARWALTPPPGDHPGWLESGGAHDPRPQRRSASAQGPGQHGKTWATGEHSSRRAAPHGSLCPQHRRWPRGQRPHCWSEKRHDRPVIALLPVALQPQTPALGLSDPFGPEDSTGASGCC